FRERVRAWLFEWNPPEKRLLLFGPSGGYSLPVEFLQRFERIDIIEPDPFARLIFKRRFPALAKKLHFAREFTTLPWWHSDSEIPERAFTEFLERGEAEYGPAAVLFSNFLGQLPLLRLNYEDTASRNGFLTALSKKSWASFHDLFSGRTIDMNRHPDSIVMSEDTEVMARRFFRNEAEVVDHGTTWLGRGRAIPVCHWLLTPRNSHVIAFISQLRK
ncbi:MAG: hypothetical protein V4692_10460, partial [Bdellovibrionota bacterium]